MLIVVGFFFVLFPMEKVKLCEDAIGWLKQIVSIPYGKGKATKQSDQEIVYLVSIPYGKGKVIFTIKGRVVEVPLYQFPMGKVKLQRDKFCQLGLYQFPMGKVKKLKSSQTHYA